MSAITTHVLDTARGVAAQGVPITLEVQGPDGWALLGTGTTDADGRLRTLLPDTEPAAPGVYRLTFDTDTYFHTLGVQGFYPVVTVHFTVRDARHHHVPLLLNPYGYSTYRGT